MLTAHPDHRFASFCADDVNDGPDDGDVAHARYITFGEVDENDDDEYAQAPYARVWRARGDKLVIQSFSSSEVVRGRDMLRWLRAYYAMPIVAVEATTAAIGFWEKMQAEGLVESIEDAEGVPSRWERISLPMKP